MHELNLHRCADWAGCIVGVRVSLTGNADANKGRRMDNTRTMNSPKTIKDYWMLTASGVAFVISYVLLDWASYLHPMYGLNITPWNPSVALGLVIWFRFGKIVALPWFVAILMGEILVRGLPTPLPLTLMLSGVLTIGYGVMAEMIRRFVNGDVLHDRRRLMTWLAIVVV